MIFEIAKWSELISTFAVLLPILSLFILVIKTGKKQLQFDLVLLAYYSVTSLFFQAVIMICSLNGINNLWLFHAFIAVELFFFSAFLLYITNENTFFISVFLSAFCYFIASKFDEPTKLPYLSVLIQFFSVLLISPGALKNAIKFFEISNSDNYSSYKDYAVKGILLTAVSNFVFIAFIEKHLILILFVHSILNIYSNYLFARTFKRYSENYL